MTRFVAVAAVAAATIALVVGLAAGWWRDGSELPAPSKPFDATATLSARALSFGDPVTARLDVLVDPVAVDAASVTVRPRFSPYRIVRTERTTRRGRTVLISYRYALECLVPACVPQRGQDEHRFLATRVSYRTAAGKRVTRSVDWPSYQVASRLTDDDRAAPGERLRSDAPLPAVSYRIAPETLKGLLIALAVVLAIAAAALAAVALRPRRRPAEIAASLLSPLESALRRVYASTANGQPAERRKALGNLGRELRALELGDLADDCGRLAWSAPEPTPEATTRLARHVEASSGETR